MLVEHPLVIDSNNHAPDEVSRLVDTGLPRANAIDCFHFVPSDPTNVWQVFSALKCGHLCEWGSGIGIATGIARMLGHQATGIEINEELAIASRQLLREFDLDCEIHHASYFDLHISADYYFVYCWPGQMLSVQELFEFCAPDHAMLLMGHGAKDIRCKVKARIDR